VCAGTPKIQNEDQIGICGEHAYTVLETAEERQQGIPKLLRVRNPWGNEKEWTGAWSKNSKQINRLVEVKSKWILPLTFIG
jgi:calpain